MQSTHLNVNKPSSVATYSRLELQSMHLPLSRPSARISVRLDKELVINIKCSMNLILCFMISSFSCFSIGTENVIYFLVFSLRHSNCCSNTSTSCLNHCEKPPEISYHQIPHHHNHEHQTLGHHH